MHWTSSKRIICTGHFDTLQRISDYPSTRYYNTLHRISEYYLLPLVVVPEPWCRPQIGQAVLYARRSGRLSLWPVSPGRQDVAEKNKLSQDAKRYGKLLQKKTLQSSCQKMLKDMATCCKKKKADQIQAWETLVRNLQGISTPDRSEIFNWTETH